jgi:uncharacterized protein involved in tellurium resistance
MSHYSEMEFLFSDINNNQNISKQLNTTSNSNTFNVLKEPSLSGSRPGYVLFKSKDGVDSDGIKNYIQSTVYKKENKSTNPYVNLINDFNATDGSHGAGLRLKASDFAYLHQLGVYPMNRMAILRRFPDGVFVPENLENMKIEPISTIVGWIPLDKNFSSVSFNETWTQTNERFDVALSEIIKKNTGGKLDIAAIVPIPDFAQGILFEFYKKAGITKSSNLNDSVDEVYEHYDPNSVTKEGRKIVKNNTWGLNNIPVGDPNVLNEAPFRNPEGQNIKSSFSFELEATYEQKLLGDVDPGSAMLDILDNIYAMGTSNMVFYWGDGSNVIQDAKNTASGKGNNLHAWWEFVYDITKSFWDTMIEILSSALKKVEDAAISVIDAGQTTDQANQNTAKLKSDQQNIINANQPIVDKSIKDNKVTPESITAQKKIDAAKKEIEKLNTQGISNSVDAKKNAAKKITTDMLSGLGTLAQTILTSTIAIHRFRLRGSIELMVGGADSSTPWHLTIGNPYSPWLNTSHIVIESATVETSNEMGFNDMPQRLTAKFTCRLSRSLGKQELMRMFNNTYRRTYSSPVRVSSSGTITPGVAPATSLNMNSNQFKDGTTSSTVDSTGKAVGVVNPAQTNPGMNGNSNDPSIVNYLNSKNQNSSYSSRAQMAANMGIQNYRGTAEQNTQMLNILRNQSNA